ncbi:MAG: AAA family ATPase, partial [Anaerolineae bacterium]|nr:AAA family ATPase [Anaerolineae bacterium]
HHSCYALMEWLRTRSETSAFRYPVWWAVALPSVNVDADEEIEPGQPRAVVLDKSDLLPANVAGAVRRIFVHYERKDGQNQPGAKGIRALEQAMARTWFLRAYMAADFEHEEEQIKRLTNAQFKILRQMDSNLRMVITGVAGSGKTMLAMEKAHRLEGEGLRVLFVCYNINLAAQIRQHLPATTGDTLTVNHFHQFAADYITRAGLTAPASKDADGKVLSDFYDNRLPNALLDAIGQSEEYYDAIVVDEGQDFKTTYWTPLQLLLDNIDGGIFYIFCDDSQRIYSRDALPFLQPRYHLDQNLRNTREIGMTVGDYHCSSDYYEAAGPESKRPPHVVNTSKYADKKEALADVLDDLKGEKIPAEHIVVLTPLGEAKSHWKTGLPVGSFKLARGIQNAKPGQIAVETIQAFKGLE